MGDFFVLEFKAFIIPRLDRGTQVIKFLYFFVKKTAHSRRLKVKDYSNR